MIKLEKYDGTKEYMYPNGQIANVNSVTFKYPAWKKFVHVVQTDACGEVMFAFQNLSAMRGIYNIDSSLTEDEAIIAIQHILNTPEVIDNSATAEERIAAALEFQNIMSLPDVE